MMTTSDLYERVERIEREVTETRSEVTAARTDIQWLKWIVTATFVAAVGHYLGLSGTLAEAASRLLP